MLLAAATQQAFAEVRAELRLPWAAMAGALVLAALGALPLLLELPLWLRTLPSFALRAVPMAVHGVASAFGSDSMVIAAGWCGAAVVLMVVGLAVAKLAPRELAWEGGQR